MYNRKHKIIVKILFLTFFSSNKKFIVSTFCHNTVECDDNAYGNHDTLINNLLRDRYRNFEGTIATHLSTFACILGFLSTSQRRVKTTANDFTVLSRGLIRGSCNLGNKSRFTTTTFETKIP